MGSRMVRIFGLIASAAVSLVLIGNAAPAHAGGMILVDQGDMYSTTGQKWPFFPATVPEPNLTTIPFALNLGSGAAANRQVFDNPHGQLQFGNGSGNPSTGDYINILYNPNPTSAGQFTPGLNITHDLGLVDPSVIDPSASPQFGDTSKGLQAYRFLFNFVCPGNDVNCGSPLQFEAIFFYLTDDKFILEFNYGGGNFFPNNNPFSQYQIGYQIGSSGYVNLTGLTNGVQSGPDFCFSSGVATRFTSVAACRAGTTAVVPEPGVISLLFMGGLALLTIVRRRPIRVATRIA